MFSPLVYTPKTLPKGTPQELKTDFQILTDDRVALEMLVQSILANKRLAWEIVSAWLEVNGKLLVDRPTETEARFFGLISELNPKEKAAMLAIGEALVEEA